jgi:hypothetical protein
LVCELQITAVVGVVPAGAVDPSIVQVSGTAVDCAQVRVTLFCDGTEFGPVIADVDGIGSWSADFRVEGCGCDDNVSVVVECVGDPTCATKFGGAMECASDDDCPHVHLQTSAVDGCAGDESVASVIVTAIVTPSTAGCTFFWNFGDGSSILQTFTPTAPPHQYTSPGSKTVSVSVVCGDCVVPAGTTVQVPPCPGDEGDGDDGDGGDDDDGDGGGGGDGGWDWGCWVSRVAIMVLLVLAAVAGYIAVCVPGAATYWYGISAAFLVSAGIAFAIWKATCDQPCGWATLLGWQVAIGSGLGALYLSNCCSELYWIGVPLILLGLGLLYRWRRTCGHTWCDVLRELLVLISGIVIPTVAWLIHVPVVSGCFSTAIGTGVISLGGLVALAVGRCLSGAEEVRPIDDVNR